MPCITPSAVVRPMTREVCDDGIPPEPTNRVKSHSFVIKWCVNTLAICAKKNPRKAATNALQKKGNVISHKVRRAPTDVNEKMKVVTLVAGTYPLCSMPRNPLRTITSPSPFGRGGAVSMFGGTKEAN